MPNSSNRTKGSIYDTLFVREMIRSTKGGAGQPQQYAKLNILDASQQRRTHLTSALVTDQAPTSVRKNRK
jgi:hypothetical protein